MPESQPPGGFTGDPRQTGATPPPPPYGASDPASGDEEWRFDEKTVTLLRQTRPWVQLLAILGFIGTGLVVLAGVVMLVVGPEGAGAGSELEPGGGVMFGVYYLALAVLYFFMSLFLQRFATNSSRFAIDPTTGHLNAALEAQKSYWRLVGIMALIFLVLMVLGVVLFMSMVASGD